MLHLNRYARKRLHKRKLKYQHAKNWFYGGAYGQPELAKQQMEERAEPNEPNKGYKYWQTYYLSGPRALAKQSTNRKIRTKYRLMIKRGDYEDIKAPAGADYEKEFDYNWTVW